MAEPETTRGRRAAETSAPRAGVALASVRTTVAQVVWLVAVVAAVFLAVGALLVSLHFNRDNTLVSFVTDVAARVDLGELKSFDPGRTPASQETALTHSVLVNWGIAAVLYLIVGKLVEKLVRP